MADLLATDRLVLFFLLFLPGFISVKVWSLIVPSERTVLTDRAIEVLSFGCINFALMFPFMVLALRTATGWQYVYLALVLFVAPMVWPILFRGLLNWKLIRQRVIAPVPKAWDAYFRRREPCFIMVHLKNGKIIGGLHSERSFASSYPNPEDLYIEQLWRIENGNFNEPIPDSRGMLISADAFDLLELFAAKSQKEGDDNGKESRKAKTHKFR